ncbi:MFS transporter [Microbispora sp. GKU 823]|uniref:MFS transporter n=1 Tax=Microbispora sp. GKU 823 TaxID=1652100 RepID=UPI0009A37D2E|nr:MFS transporter [Microbispora sp. GKU 823]OPG14141.1 MFS transporter [Microbispora sp. GKU 823]
MTAISPAVARSIVLRRSAVASTVGSAVEFYEFTIYGFLAVVFAPLFFPSSDPAASTLSALAVFGGGYLARPLGGILFGVLGDRIGRRTVLMSTIFLMGGASTLIGLLPTYNRAGLLAPALLLALRLLQGLSAGGEFTGAQTYIVEMAPAHRRGALGSLPALGIGLGFGTASLVVAATSASLSAEQMSAWGWRLPFLLCLPLTIVCLFLRLRLEDSPEFAAIVANAAVTRTPVRDVIRGHLGDVSRVAALTVATLGPGFLVKLYLGIHLVQVKGMDPIAVYGLLGVLLLSTAVLFPLMGQASDRKGRRPIMRIGFAAFLVLSVPLFLVVDATSRLWLIAPMVLVFAAVEPFVSAAVYTTFAELFPARMRYTATSIGFNLGTIVAAGFGPYICSRLTAWIGWEAAPGLWGAVCALLGLLVLGFTRETGRTALAR